MSANPFDDEFPPGATKDRPLALVKEAPDPRKRKPLDWPDLAGKEPPERRWAIRGWVGFGHVTLMVGSGGIGKTLLAQQMASCLALGKPFIGDVPEPLKCLMWACEDDHDELWRRQLALAKWCNAGLEVFAERLVIVPRHGLDNALVTTEYGRLLFSPLIEALSEQARDLKSDVVILDNVAQLYGGSENDRHAVTAFMNALAGALPGLALLLLAHPSRATGSEFSGSSAWENVARTRLYLGASLPGHPSGQESEEPTDNVRYLSRRKANYSAKDWRRLTYADGALTPDIPQTEGGVIEAIRAGNAQKTVIAAIQRFTTLGIPTSNGKRSSNYLPKLILEYKLHDGLTSPELGSALRSLLLDGKIKTDLIGRNKSRNPVQSLVCVL